MASMGNESGRIGEDYTAGWLQRNGYAILDRNYHSRYGEIDIIASDGKYIIFVEVKTRAAGAKGSPLEAVTKGKRQKIIRTALLYLAEHPELERLQCRFDVAGLTVQRGSLQIQAVDYIPNAFEGEMA